MLLRGVAIDYDGTVAHDGIEKARWAGLFVVIITGRICQASRWANA